MENKFNNIDDLFRQQANKLADETNQMEADWDEMKALLIPVASGGSLSLFNRYKKYFFAALLSICLIGTTIFLFFKKKDDKVGTIATNKSVAPKQQAINQTIDTTLKNRAIVSTPQNLRLSFPVIDDNQPMDHFVYPAAVIPNDSLVPGGTPINNLACKLSLDSIYNTLKKPSQSFTIDNNRENMITASAGTRLLIPANAFDSAYGNITIVIDEYYNYSDMIPVKLITLSQGQQLVSGGMLHIKAMQNGKEVQLRKGKSIAIEMPTNQVDNNMQLFMGSKTEDESIDWVLTRMDWTNWCGNGKDIQVMNLQNEPMKLITGQNKLIGIFRIPSDCKMSKEEIKNELQKRYTEYSKIRVRRSLRKASNITKRKHHQLVGDSVKVDSWTADKYNLWADGQKAAYEQKKKNDTVLYRNNIIGKFRNWGAGNRSSATRDTTAAATTVGKYYFTVANMGWINCDRFYYDKRPKVQFAVNIGMPASQCYSHLIFTKIKSALYGRDNGNKVYFDNIPVGEEVKFVSIGIKNNKVVSCSKTLVIGKDEVKDIEYKELKEPSPELKKQLEALNLL